MHEPGHTGRTEPPPAHGKLIPIDEVAERLCCSVSHVRNLITNGDLPAVNIGVRRAAMRVRERDCETFIEARLSAVAAGGAA
jgi:excisionase family DNA binding protein